MTGLVRAFVWLRWRLLVNSLRGGRRRDMLERVSRAAAVIVPLVLAVMLIPLSLGLAAAASFAGWQMGSAAAPHPIFLLSARGLLGLLTAAIVISPIVRSVQSAGTGSERFTLLPIPRRLLHALEMVAGLADPWILILVPAFFALPAGLLAAGAPAAAAAALAAGALLLATLLGLSSLLSNGLQWIYRSRKRGEIVTLVVLIGLSLAGFLPMFVGNMVEQGARKAKAREHAALAWSSPSTDDPATDAADRPGGDAPEPRDQEPPERADASGPAEQSRPGASSRSDGSDEPAASASSSASEEHERPTERVAAAREGDPWALAPRAVRIVVRGLPSELYVGSLAGAIGGRPGRALGSLGALLLAACALYALSWRSYRQILETPPSGASGRGAGELRIIAPRVPGLGPAASAIAYAHVRSTLRTVQGKMILFFSPIAVTIAFILFTRMERGPLHAAGIGAGGAPVLWLGAGMGLLSLQKMILNQFAIDRAGFTMQLLSPVSARDLLIGKAAGMAALYALLFSYFLIFAVVAGRGAPLVTWVPPILGAASAFLIYAPIAAMLSALFPRSADLNRMGSGGNPSGLATFLGLLFAGVAMGPPAALAFGALVLARSPWLAVGLAAAWTLIAIPVSYVLMRLAARTLESRFENIALVAQGR